MKTLRTWRVKSTGIFVLSILLMQSSILIAGGRGESAKTKSSTSTNTTQVVKVSDVDADEFCEQCGGYRSARAPRLDAPNIDDPSNPVSPFDSADLDAIRRCVCQLKNGQKVICSKLEVIESKVDDVDMDLSIHDEIMCSKAAVIESKVDDVDFDLSNHDVLMCSKAAVIESKVDDVDVDLSNHDVLMCSKAAVIESKVDDVDEDLSIHDRLICSKIEDLDFDLSVHDEMIGSQLDFVQETLCDKLETVIMKIDMLSGSNLDNFISTFTTLEEISDKVMDNMVAIKSVSDEIMLDISDLDAMLDSVGSKVCVVESKVDDVDDDLSAHDALVCSKLEGIDAKVDDLDDDLSAHDSLVCSKLEGIDSKIDNTDDDLSIHDQLICSKLDVIDEELSIHDELICSKVELLLACGAQPITGPTVIGDPGQYCLESDFTVTAGDGIVIDASDVVLDLSGRTIFGGGGDNGVVIKNDRENVTVINGTMRDLLQAGMLVEGDKCVVRGCDFVANSTGILLSEANDNIVDECVAQCNTFAGFALDSSNENMVTNCKAIRNGVDSESEAFGFVSSLGKFNLFECCGAESTITTTGVATLAAGFALRCNECSSKVLKCKSCNTRACPSDADTFGFLLPTITNPLTIQDTATDPSGIETSDVNSVDWSPDGQFLVAGVLFGPEVRVLGFDGFALSPIATATFTHGTEINSVDWSSDSRFVAAGGGTSSGVEILVFEFDDVGLILDFEDSEAHGATINSVRWSPDGQFLAVGGAAGTGGFHIRVYSFDTNTRMLTLLTSVAQGATVQEVRWSPDGRFLAVAGGTNGLTRVYEFDSTGPSLTLRDSEAHGADVNAVDWSPDGKFVVSGGPSGAGGSELRVYSFNNSTLTLVEQTNTDAGNVFALEWSPDGCTIGVGEAGSDTRFLDFSASRNTLTFRANGSLGGTTGVSAAWRFDGKYFASSTAAGTSSIIRVFTGDFTTQCIVKDCFASGTGGGAGGTGFSIGTGTNVVVSNFSCGNTTNYDIGTKYPISPATGLGIGEAENIDCDLTGPTVIQSKICAVDEDLSIHDQLLCSKLAVLESKLDILLP